jgi:hypothetical protein
VSWCRSSSLTSPHNRIEFVFEYPGFVVDVVTAGFAVQQRVRNARNGQRPRPAPEPRGEVPPPTSSLMVLPLVSQRSVSSPLLSMSQRLDQTLQECDKLRKNDYLQHALTHRLRW